MPVTVQSQDVSRAASGIVIPPAAGRAVCPAHRPRAGRNPGQRGRSGLHDRVGPPFCGLREVSRVFLLTNPSASKMDFEKDHQNLIKHNIKIVRGPVLEEYGKVLVFEDLYGNLWDLIG